MRREHCKRRKIHDKCFTYVNLCVCCNFSVWHVHALKYKKLFFSVIMVNDVCAEIPFLVLITISNLYQSWQNVDPTSSLVDQSEGRRVFLKGVLCLRYTSPDFLYIRSWLPCIFFAGVITMGNIGRQLALVSAGSGAILEIRNVNSTQ